MDTPREHANELLKLAEEYSDLGNELAKILVEKSSAILILMATSKSIKEAEIRWQCETSGKRETEIVYKMRGIKELIGCVKLKIRVINNEINSHY